MLGQKMVTSSSRTALDLAFDPLRPHQQIPIALVLPCHRRLVQQELRPHGEGWALRDHLILSVVAEIKVQEDHSAIRAGQEAPRAEHPAPMSLRSLLMPFLSP